MIGQGPIVAEFIRAKADALAEEALRAQGERWPGLFDSMSAEQLRHTRQDTRFHIDFIASTVWTSEQRILDDYALWLKTLFEGLDLPLEWATGSLSCVRQALRPVIGEPDAAFVEPFIDRCLASFDSLDTALPSHLDPMAPHNGLAVRFLGAILSGDRDTAVRVVMDAVETGTSPRDIYHHVFGPAQLEIGRLWHAGSITVAQEHYATAVTQLVMSQLYRHIFLPERPHVGTLVAACIDGELHDMGLRMITDLLEMEGWRTHFLGASAPADAVVDAIVRQQPDVVTLSVAISTRIPDLGRLIARLKADDRTSRIPILVGGRALDLVPELSTAVGADAYAADAASADAAARRLMSEARDRR